MKGNRWPREIIAAVKAARELGIPYKAISRATGVGVNTAISWARGVYKSDVEPDPQFKERFANLFRECGLNDRS